MTTGVRTVAVEEGGLRPLDLTPERGLHDALDGLPLGVYTAFRTFQHTRVFALEDHLDRIDRSMELSDWGERLDRSRVRAALAAVIAGSPFEDTVLRLDVLAPVASWSPAERARAGGLGSRTLITSARFVDVPAEARERGVRVELADGLHRFPARIKYASFVLDRRRFPVGTPDAFERVLLDPGRRILEGTTSNVFFLLDGELRTAGSGVLEGITRRYVLACCRELGLAVREEAILLEEVERADEAFLSSSTRRTVPIVSVASRTIGDGVPGPWSRRLEAALTERILREARPVLE